MILLPGIIASARRPSIPFAFDPGVTAANIVLSTTVTARDTATRAASSDGFSSSFCSASISVNSKRYMEFLVTELASIMGVIFGVRPTADVPLNLNTYVGAGSGQTFGVDANGSSYDPVFGQNGLGFGDMVNGDRHRLAIDVPAGLLWFGRNSAWFSGANPATGVGATYRFTPGTVFSLGVSFYRATEGGVICTSPATVAGPVPAGFSV